MLITATPPAGVGNSPSPVGTAAIAMPSGCKCRAATSMRAVKRCSICSPRESTCTSR